MILNIDLHNPENNFIIEGDDIINAEKDQIGRVQAIFEQSYYDVSKMQLDIEIIKS